MPVTPALLLSGDGSPVTYDTPLSVSGDLVVVPFTTKSLSVNAVNSAGGNAASFVYNSDGLQPDTSEATLLAKSPPTNGLINGSGAYLAFYVHGRTIGLRFNRYSGAGPIDWMIDGIVGRVDDTTWKMLNQSSTPLEPANVILATGLPDGPHRVFIMACGDPNNLADVRCRLLGFIAERRAGYRENPGLIVPATGSVPTTATVIANALTSAAARSLRRVDYVNGAGSATAITVQFNSVTVWAQSIAAGGMASFDPGDHAPLDGTALTFRHSASQSGATFAAYMRP